MREQMATKYGLRARSDSGIRVNRWQRSMAYVRVYDLTIRLTRVN